MEQRQREKEKGRFRKKTMRLLESARKSARRMLMPSKKRKALDNALTLAARDGDNTEMMRLIKAGADIAAKGDIGTTALHRAAFWGHAKTCALLISEFAKAGKDIKKLIAEKDKDDETALHLAARTGNTQTVWLLGSIPKLQDWMGKETFNSFLSAFMECASQ